MVKYISFDPAIRNCAYAKMNIDDENKISDLTFDIFDLTNNKKVLKCSFEEIISNLLWNLKLLNCDDVDMVLIENVPSMKNPMLKSVSICIYVYYLNLGYNVKLISPNTKPDEIKKCKTYNERKKKSIELGLNLLNENDKIKIQRYKKQDDITDCIIACKSYHDKINKLHN
jgi:hypothetical protein